MSIITEEIKSLEKRRRQDILIKVKYSKLSLDNDNAERQLMGKSHMTSP